MGSALEKRIKKIKIQLSTSSDTQIWVFLHQGWHSCIMAFNTWFTDPWIAFSLLIILMLLAVNLVKYRKLTRSLLHASRIFTLGMWASESYSCEYGLSPILDKFLPKSKETIFLQIPLETKVVEDIWLCPPINKRFTEWQILQVWRIYKTQGFNGLDAVSVQIQDSQKVESENR